MVTIDSISNHCFFIATIYFYSIDWPCIATNFSHNIQWLSIATSNLHSNHWLSIAFIDFFSTIWLSRTTNEWKWCWKCSLRITTVSHIEFTRAQFNHRIVPGQAVQQFTSTSCLQFHKDLKLYIATIAFHFILWFQLNPMTRKLTIDFP
jgi:hypothetical protein